MVTVQLKQIRVPPGQRLELQQLSWQDFEAILAELGEHRGTRLAYTKGTLEIMTPLPEHEISKELIGDMVKILFEELNISNECFGSTTFKREDMNWGIEPDNCFYIQNYQTMIGKSRVDLTVDPPPDLVLEVDVTSKTKLDIYEALGVPELWQYENRKLKIYLLQNNKYVQSNLSLIFSNLPIIERISNFLEQGRTIGRSATLKAFREWVRLNI